MSTELQGLMQLLETVVDAGAASAELYLNETSGIDVSAGRARAQHVDVVERNLRIRAWLTDGRVGEASGAPERVNAMVKTALARAEKAPPLDGGGPVERLPMVLRGLGIDDRRFPLLTMADRLEVITSIERGARGVDRAVQTRDFLYTDRRTRRALVNTNDVSAEEWSTTYRAEGAVLVGDVTLSEAIATRSFSSISSLPLGVVLARRAVALQASEADPAGVTRVMMPPRVTGPMFARLAEGFVLERLQAGKSLFSEGWRAQRSVVDPRIHLIDDPQLPGGLRTWSFDEEGVPPIALALLREGVPATHYRTRAQARALDMRPSGHVWGGAVIAGNLMLRSGTRSMSALLSENNTVRTLMIDHVSPWSGLDLATGDFELRASGFVQRGNDQVEGPVRGVRMRGNILTLLSGLVEIASDTDRVGHVDAPGLLCDGVTLG